MKINEIIDYGVNKLNEYEIEDSNIKAKRLLQYVLNENSTYIIVNYDKQLAEQQEKEYKKYVEEIINGKPLQYITKSQEFMKLEFYVDENVLIPQPDTEILVEEAVKELEQLAQNRSSINVLDLCTGSGAIAVSIAKYVQEILKKQYKDVKVQVYASDISEKAIEIANRNAMVNDVNISIIQSDMFKDISTIIESKFDIIVSNPPYIETETINKLSKEVQQEPHIALDGGDDGLYFYKVISRENKSVLNSNGIILLEIGYNQKESVTEVFKKENLNLSIICKKDLSGNDRVLIIK